MLGILIMPRLSQQYYTKNIPPQRKTKKTRNKSTKTKQPQSCRPTAPYTPVGLLTDNAVITRPETEVANLRKSATPRPTLDHTKATKAKDECAKTQGKTTLISSSLGAGIERTINNRTRKTCSYV